MPIKQITGGDINVDPASPSAVVMYRWDSEGETFIGDPWTAVAQQALLSLPQIFQHPLGDCFLQDIQVHENWAGKSYTITAPYGRIKKEVGAYQIRVQQSGGTVHVTAGTRISGWGPDGGGAPLDEDPFGPFYKNNHGLIGVDGDETQGTDIPVAETKVIVQFQHPRGVLIPSYIRAVGELVGFPNDAPFLSYEEGEVMFLGGDFGENPAEATAAYTYAISYNQRDFLVGEIPIEFKSGWDVISPWYGDDVVNSKEERKIQYIEIIRPAGREFKNYLSVFGWGA